MVKWSIVKKSTISNGFRIARLLRVEECSTGDLPPDESDERDNESDPISDKAIPRLINSVKTIKLIEETSPLAAN